MAKSIRLEMTGMAAILGAAALAPTAFVPTRPVGGLRGTNAKEATSYVEAPSDIPEAVSSESSSSSGHSALALGCVAAAAAGITVQRRARSAASVVARRADKNFAGGLLGGEGVFDDYPYNFDPLGLAERWPEQLPFFREAELKHGRIAMLAWVGLFVPSFVRIPGPSECYEASVIDALLPCYQSGALLQVSILITVLEVCGTWAKMTPTPYIPLTDGRSTEYLTLENAGDYRLGLNYLPKNENEAKGMKLKELKNGRLAMLAFGGAITQAALTGNDFPWLYAEAPSFSSRGPSFVSRPMIGATRSKVAMRAKIEGGYEMSASIPFLPKSPALTGYVGEETGFDPMGFTYAVDIMFLREAELKHGRIAMLATVGWIATDLGFRLPGAMYDVPTLSAHEVMVKAGPMSQILIWTSLLEVFGLLALTNMYEGTTDRKPGDFYLRFLYPADEEGQKTMQLKELKNGRLAMLAFSGIVTVGQLTGTTWPFLSANGITKKGDHRSSFCGSFKAVASSAKSSWRTTRHAEERAGAHSVPFLPKPKNLAGWVGEEAEFDPLQFSEWYDIKWLREAELKHGRVSMLATVGFLGQTVVAFPGVSPEADSVAAAASAPPELWGALIFAAGWIESSVYNGKITMLDMFQEDPERVPGNLGFGSSRLEDMSEEDSKLMQYKELKNGRLAMLAIGGMIAHNLVVNGPLFPLVPDGWSGPLPTVAPGFY